MKILIDIPDKDIPEKQSIIDVSFHFIDGMVCECDYPFDVLPKGCGNLIDADDLIQDIIDDSQLCIFNSECERIVHDKMVDFAVDRIAEAPPIIKANKGEEE